MTKSLQDYCRSLPGVTEDIKWENDLCFCIGGKMFCVFPLGESEDKFVSFKCTPENFERLTEMPGFMPAPYLARAGWVAIVSRQAASGSEIPALLAEACDL